MLGKGFQIILVRAGKEFPAIVSCMQFSVDGSSFGCNGISWNCAVNISNGVQYWAHQEKIFSAQL